MRTRTKLLVTLLSPLVGVLALELGFRVLGLEATPMPKTEGMLFSLSATPGLTYVNRKGAERRTEYRDKAGGEPRVVLQRINAQGFRGPQVSPAKPPGTFRIACLGDSHTFGTGVGELETWPAQLQALCEGAGAAGRPVEVMNWGVSAYDTTREVILLRARVLEFDPDLVILQYHVNDVSPRDQIGWKPGPQDALYRWSDPAGKTWWTQLRKVSKLADWCLDRVHRYRSVRDEAGLSMEKYAADSPGWRAVCAGLVNARDLLLERGIEFRLVLFPYLLRTGEHLSSHRAFQQVSEYAAQEGIACLDGESVFAGLDLASLRVHAHDSHANGEAYGLFSRALFDWLQLGNSLPLR